MRPYESEQPVIFGEVLFDHFPDGSVVLGGAPFNVAWNLNALGANPLFISRVGNDPLGRKICEAMRGSGMSTRGIQMDSAHPTGSVQVQLKDGQPSFAILPDQAYDFIDAADVAPVYTPPVLYHGSLALRNEASRSAMNELRRRANPPIFVDVNLRAPWWERVAVIEMLKQARWAKLNDEELNQLAPKGDSLEDKARELQKLCDLSLLVVTKGAEGAIACSDRGDSQEIVPDRGIPVIDPVGAGDAFSAVLLLGLLSDWSLQQTLQRAQSFASAVVGLRGATSSADAGFYKAFVDTWGLA
ncbi:MAG: carbohydrate kinase [Pseudomonadota bacterium]